MGLKEFLVATKLSQNDLQSRTKVHIVIGNESCDLDSTVCAITYAYYLHKLKLKPGTSILPVLCIHRDKFRIRLETVFLLRKHNILPEDLIFLDDLDLDALCRNESIALTATLVDHHVLSPSEACLKDRVTEVLDHRPLAGFLPNSWNAQIEPVGSCATLVARKILSSEDFNLDPTVAELLLGTILIDTGNLSTSDNLATPVDHEILVKLKSFLPPSISATSIFDEIHASKFDLSSLTVSEMLQKDLKVLKGIQFAVAMSTITMDLQDVLKRPEFSSDASEFCRTLPADAIIIMAFVSGDGGILHRWIAIYSGDKVRQGQLADVLLSCTSPYLDLEPLTLAHELSNVTVFKQKNLQASRKKVLPFIQNFLAREITAREENLNSSGQFVYTDPGERGDNCEEETRRHINLAKTFQSDQFRSSQDRYDLAAVGMEALISPSLSSESGDLVCPDGEIDGREDLVDVGQPLDLVLNNQGGCGDFLLSPHKQSNDPENLNNLMDLNEVAPSTGIDERLLGTDVPSQESLAHEGHVLTLVSNGDIQPTSSDTTNISDSVLSEDILQNHTHFDLLCPTNVDSPLDMSSMPTSGQASGQGSKVPSYPDTPPNSFMESSGVVYFKETQLPSFNSSEMVRRIHAKKATLAGHTGVKDFRYDNTEDDEGYEALCVGGIGGSNSGGSLISPAVPQNSYMDLTAAYDQQIPKLANSDILERVIEKRSQFEWNVESLDESGGALGDFIPANHIRVEPFTPQNSFIEGSFDTYARSTLPSINNAESVAKIRAKQSAMFGGSGSSDESGGCQSPDIGGKSPRIPSPYTPQNSYRDSMLVLESRNMIPDLNEVAERLSVEHSSKPQFVGGAREEEQCSTNQQNHAKPTRHSSSQSDSQNTMSDVDSLMSVSTDVGTPSDNIVATSLAGLMRNEMALLGRKDTNDSEVFGPVGKSEDNLADSKKSDGFSRFNHVGSPPKVTFMSGRGESRKVGFEDKDKDLFSPVDEGQLRTVEDHAFYQAAESIVAQSVAAALQSSKNKEVCAAADGSGGGRLRWSNNTVNFIEDDLEDGQENDDAAENGQENHVDSENEDENTDIESDDTANDHGDTDDELPVDRTNSNTANFEEKLKSRPLTQDTLQMSSNELPEPSSIQESVSEHPTAAEGNGDADSLESALMETALRELAYEFANDLIQSVLNDFPFNAEEREDNRKGPSSQNKDKYTQQPRKNSSEKCKSLDMNMSSSSERKWSRDNDPAFTIVEGELTETFPERKQSSEVAIEDSKEMSQSFPYRKFSKSEDFPARRFSREENLSRRSSRPDDSEYESSIKREDLETDYLPNMDPLQGNLDIIDASYSKITDADREVVEEESFRKVSAEHLFKDNKDTESNNSGLNSEDSNLIDEDGELSEEAFKKMASKSRKKIRVSFSEDFDDDIGDFNIQSSSRPHLKSPPPPLLSQDSLSSSPPLVDPMEPEEYPRTLLSAAEKTSEKAERSDGDDDAEAHQTAPNAAHEQVGKMIESAEETLAEIDRDLDFFKASHSLASPNLPNPSPLALPADHEPHPMMGVRSPQLHPVLNVSCDPLAQDVTSKNHGQKANVDSERPLTKLTASPAFTDPLHTHARNLSSTSFGSIKGAEYTEEWQDDDIVEMAAQSGLDAPSLDSLRKKIVPDSSVLQAIANDDGDDGVGSEDDEDPDPDSESESGDLEWENDTPVKTPPRPGIEPTITPEASTEGGHARWKRVSVSGSQFDIDMQAIEPFRNVLSHGGYYAEGLNAIIVFYGCHLPSRRREDYTYVMNHLFHYVIHTLEELVADDYVIIYFHGSTPRRQMPGLSWLKRCYQSIDRRLKKNLKGLFLVHPTLWLRTIVTMIRPFISSKFSSKLKFVRSLEELNSLVPMASVTIPEAITQLEELMKQNPHYLEEQEEEERRQMKEEERAEKRKEKERKKNEKDRKKQEEERKKQEKDRKKQEESERKHNAKLEKEKKKQEKEREKERKKEEQKSKAKK